ncbi:hypothetical protein KIP88_16080 [Bradyrhizobium sp. SRL28]|uniref:hypothetical protein n=1 Tax=Bradyrhizobium sp. SRL28 TaxID=2836178 RepID=UPI001BDE7E55|nr:hypothetical protein [Bradyrhizobium sp. SRL28]MBT1512026.1 hypothetical protein [Bradyrhizobium sp. SRL28]
MTPEQYKQAIASLLTGTRGPPKDPQQANKTPDPKPTNTPESLVRLRDLPPDQAVQYLDQHGHSLTPSKQLELSGPLLDAYNQGRLSPAQTDRLKSFVADMPNGLDNGLTYSQRAALTKIQSGNTNTAPAPPSAVPAPNAPTDPSLKKPEQVQQGLQKSPEIRGPHSKDNFEQMSDRYKAIDAAGRLRH